MQTSSTMKEIFFSCLFFLIFVSPEVHMQKLSSDIDQIISNEQIKESNQKVELSNGKAGNNQNIIESLKEEIHLVGLKMTLLVQEAIDSLETRISSLDIQSNSILNWFYGMFYVDIYYFILFWTFRKGKI